MLRHGERFVDNIHENKSLAQNRITAFIRGRRGEGDKARKEPVRVKQKHRGRSAPALTLPSPLHLPCATPFLFLISCTDGSSAISTATEGADCERLTVAAHMFTCLCVSGTEASCVYVYLSALVQRCLCLT